MSSTIYEIGVFVGITAVCITWIVFSEEKMINIPIFPVILISGVYVLIYIIARAVWRYKDHGSIWKGKKIFGNSWFKEISENVEMQMPAELVKRYNRINKKRVRRGKEEMTQEEFMEKLRKEDRDSRKVGTVVMIIIAFFIVGQVVYSAINESLLDAFIFAVIMLAVETPIYFGFFRGKSARERVVEKCDRMGITVVEYANGDYEIE